MTANELADKLQEIDSKLHFIELYKSATMLRQQEQEIEKLKTNLHNVIVSSAKKICNKCNDTDWVCENHPDQEAHACKHCGGAGMPCECLKKARDK